MGKSIGSEIKYPNGPFCLYVSRLTSSWKQRVKIAKCQQNNDQQKFDYREGRLHLRANPKVCLGYENYPAQNRAQAALTAQSCFANTWGSIVAPAYDGSSDTPCDYSVPQFSLLDADDAMRLTWESDDLCAYKRY